MNEVKRSLANLNRERNGAALYKALAAAEGNPKLAEVYRRLSQVEDRHAETWIQRLRDANTPIPKFNPSWRTRLLGWLAHRFGVGFVLPSISSLEQVDSHDYAEQGDLTKMAADEQSHTRLLKKIAGASGGLEGGLVARLEGRHSGAGGNALRAAVLGANDGLVSILSLVMGVAGAEMPGSAILVSGLAGLLAGASSMAMGEWLSVQSSRELYQHQLETERMEIEENPREEAEELALIYQAKGLEETKARDLADQIISDEAKAVETLAREELGIEPESLGGSAREAAATSFILFAVGAIVPIAPFVLLSGLPAVLASIFGSAIGLFIIGAGITLFTGRGVLYSGGRQVAFGLAAAALTYAIGYLIGVRIAA